MSKLISLLENVSVTDKGNICLNDIVQEYVQSTNPKVYMKKIVGKITIGSKFYITEKQCLAILEQGRSTECKKLMLQLNEEPSTGKEMMNMIDVSKGIFRLGGKTITSIMDVVGTVKTIWMKAKEIATLLEYEDTKDAIKVHVPDKNKETYDNLNKLLKGGEKILLKSTNKTTIFINIAGLFSLIMRSKMQKAKEFQEWVTDVVLPSLYQHGSYSIQETQLDFSSIYTTKVISDYFDKNVLYIGYIGKHNGENIFKFGITSDFIRRKTEHEKTYGMFELVLIEETDNDERVETLFRNTIKCMKLNRELEFSAKNRIELFTTTEVHTLDVVKKYAIDIISNNKLPKIMEAQQLLKDAQQEIKTLKMQAEIDAFTIKTFKRKLFRDFSKEKKRTYSAFVEYLSKHYDGLNVSLEEFRLSMKNYKKDQQSLLYQSSS